MEFVKPEFVIYGTGENLVLGHTGANTEWDNMGNTKPCAGCNS